MPISSPLIHHHQTSNRKRIAKDKPPFYSVHDDDFYHGPAWVIKPRLFQQKEDHLTKPGPAHYHIADRSIYTRPEICLGKTIGSRHETTPPVSNQLLAHYYPNDHCTSNAKVPAISVTPRRTERVQQRGYIGRFYLPSELTDHHRAPLLRPLYGSIISRKPLNHRSDSLSPGPAAYPMYEFDEDILPRPKPGITQKHRLSSDPKQVALQINPPFYYPNKADHHRLPSFSIAKRLFISKRTNQYATPFYTPLDSKALCTSSIQPGATLKGRWSPLVYIGTTHIPKT